MSVRPVDMLMLQQINEVSHIRQIENARPMQEQAAIINHEQKEVETKAEQVNQKDDVDNQSQKYDARDKSNNEYHGNDNNHKQKKNKDDGIVRLKSSDNGGFDIKI